MAGLTFTNPQALWFLLFIPLTVITHFLGLNYSRSRAMKFSNFEALNKAAGEQPVSNHYVTLALRVIAISCIVLAVAGATFQYDAYSNDSDYVIAVDVTSSMQSNDIAPTRLGAAQKAVGEFLSALPPTSNVGLVAFAGAPLIKIRPTTDLARVKKEVDALSISQVGGTAIGGTVIASVSLLQNSKNSKTIVVVTDGENSVGASPDDAVSYASGADVTIDTIGVGTFAGGDIGGVRALSAYDEDELTRIAVRTGGKFYPARNQTFLVQTLRGIAKSGFRQVSFGLSSALLLIALLLVIIEWALGSVKSALARL
ncbi:VWA domain-containing protein [Candidatus Micrarchaeota archaeon]|nr:VWA domain-containing protein [Candidatus Micrarchaeota archaeon]